MFDLPPLFWFGAGIGVLTILALIGLYYLLVVLPFIDRGDD